MMDLQLTQSKIYEISRFKEHQSKIGYIFFQAVKRNSERFLEDLMLFNCIDSAFMYLYFVGVRYFTIFVVLVEVNNFNN